MAIKAIIFDCFGVLIMSGTELFQNDFPEHTQAVQDLSLRSDYGFISRAEFDQELSGMSGIPLDQIEARYWKKSVRNESAFEWIHQLRSEGKFKIGLLSNIGRGWLDDFLPRSEREQLFDAEVLSNEAGMVKPDPQIFTLIAERLGVEPNECIMIDDLLGNTDGANRADMQTILFTTTKQAQQDVNRLLLENA